MSAFGLLRVSVDAHKRHAGVGGEFEFHRQTVRIVFPGGDVEVVRAVDEPNADYWVHLRVNRPSDGQCVHGEDEMAKIIDARIDIRGGEQTAVPFEHPETYHIAVRVKRDGIYRLPNQQL